MDDVHFGYVYDFGAGEEWTARRGEGAWLNGERLGGVRPKDTLETLGLRGDAHVADRRARGGVHRSRIASG